MNMYHFLLITTNIAAMSALKSKLTTVWGDHKNLFSFKMAAAFIRSKPACWIRMMSVNFAEKEKNCSPWVHPDSAGCWLQNHDAAKSFQEGTHWTCLTFQHGKPRRDVPSQSPSHRQPGQVLPLTVVEKWVLGESMYTHICAQYVPFHFAYIYYIYNMYIIIYIYT